MNTYNSLLVISIVIVFFVLLGTFLDKTFLANSNSLQKGGNESTQSMATKIIQYDVQTLMKDKTVLTQLQNLMKKIEESVNKTVVMDGYNSLRDVLENSNTRATLEELKKISNNKQLINEIVQFIYGLYPSSKSYQIFQRTYQKMQGQILKLVTDIQQFVTQFQTELMTETKIEYDKLPKNDLTATALPSTANKLLTAYNTAKSNVTKSNVTTKSNTTSLNKSTSDDFCYGDLIKEFTCSD